MTTQKGPSHTRLRRFALPDLGRKHALSPIARLTLLALTEGADFKTATWRGTLIDLAEDTGAGRAATGRAVETLVAAGLIGIEEPFVGHGRTGLVRVLAYKELVVGTSLDPVNNSGRSDERPVHPLADVCALSATGSVHSVRDNEALEESKRSSGADIPDSVNELSGAHDHFSVADESGGVNALSLSLTVRSSTRDNDGTRDEGERKTHKAEGVAPLAEVDQHDDRPSEDELRALRCPDCGGMPAAAAKWQTTPWRPGKFCSCPFDAAHP